MAATLAVQVSGGPVGSFSPIINVAIYASPQLSPGVSSFPSSKMRFIGLQNWEEWPWVFEFLGTYVEFFGPLISGRKIFFEFRQVNTDTSIWIGELEGRKFSAIVT